MGKKISDYPGLVDRFISYVKIDTQSDENSESRPSTDKQHVLLDKLMEELVELGCEDVEKTDYSAVMATLPANLPADHPNADKVPTIGFIAHVDTYPATSGANVKPQIVKNYDGGRIKLNDDLYLDPDVDEGLVNLKGDDIIHTDGSTLLGADDKAGIAEIMHAVTLMQTQPDIYHGKIRIAFTVDEEIGKGADEFDLEHFGADFAYTMDGSVLGEMEDETFCADSATITIEGYDVHPGYAKNKLINAVRVASYLISKFHLDKLPETTEHKQGYLHPYQIEGDVSKVTITCLVRDFKEEGLKKLEVILEDICKATEREFPEAKTSIEIKEFYRNMKYELDKHPHVMDLARKSMQELDIDPVTRPIRGGTDGSRLTLMGLPTPNIFAGGENFHSVKEYVSIQTMEKASMVILGIVGVAQKMAAKGKL